MEELKERLPEFLSDRLYQIIISNPRSKGEQPGNEISKIKIRPVMVKGEVCFQETVTKGTQVFHENYSKEEALCRIPAHMQDGFRQLDAQSMDARMTVLISKKGKVTVKFGKINRQEAEKGRLPDLSHNRQKRYLLPEGVAVPFLVDLGVQTKEGVIVRSKYDKFKQINRYLEFVEDILPTLDNGKPVRIVDFGCGKSYLTFALYYYLHEIKGIPAVIVGLDLKKDVIEKCNLLAGEYGFRDLHFYHGDISTYEGTKQVDMVVTLHACDTATDYAIKKAVDWNARVIFTVPCCQHEVNGQISSEYLGPVLKYGLLKERLSAILTDAVRANLLEEAGYETQILEFIDMEHTPKNLLIRAVKKNRPMNGTKNVGAIWELTKDMQVETTLQKLMGTRNR